MIKDASIQESKEEVHSCIILSRLTGSVGWIEDQVEREGRGLRVYLQVADIQHGSWMDRHIVGTVAVISLIRKE